MKRLRRRVYELVGPAPDGDLASRLVDLFVVALIILDVAWFIYDSTVEDPRVFGPVGGPILIAFSVEYVLRFWSCKEDPRYAVPWGRLRYAVTLMALVDLIAIVPLVSLIPMLFGQDALGGVPAALTTVRIFRLFRMAKLFRYFEAVSILPRTVWRIRNELGALAVGLVMAILSSSLIMHQLEKDANPAEFGDVPQCMWWSVVTMTSVGYGDAIPVTDAGRIVAGLLMVIGMATFAIPAGLMAAAFTREVTVAVERKRAQRDRRQRLADSLRDERLEAVIESKLPDTCPHCGKNLEVSS